MRNSGETGSEMTVKHLWKEGAVPVSGGSDPMSEIGESDTWMDQVKTLIRQNKLAAASAVLILLIILAAVFAPLVAPYDHLAQSLTDRLQTPSMAHWLGTDELGRDVLSRIIFGARISLTIGLVPTLISMAIGTVLGLCAGVYGGKVDFVIMRLADVMLAFPSLLLAMVVMYTMGGGLINIFIALSLINWASTARSGPFPDAVSEGKGVCGSGKIDWRQPGGRLCFVIFCQTACRL